MTTMDLVKLAGGEPANFLDIGGGAKADRVAAAFRIILDDPNVQGHPGQHLRRHHARRRGGARHRGGAQHARARRADGGPHRGHQRRGGEAHPGRQADLITADSLDDAAAKAVPRPRWLQRRRPHEHPGRAETRAWWCRASPAARASSIRRPCSSTARRSSPASRPARAGRWRWTARAGVRHHRRCGRPDRRQHLLHLRARRLRARRHARGGRCRRALVICITEGCPRSTCCGSTTPEGARRAADRPELPRRHHARRGQGGDHPRLHPSARLGGPGEPLRHADLRGRPGA